MNDVYLLDPANARYLSQTYLNRPPRRISRLELTSYRADEIVRLAQDAQKLPERRRAAWMRWGALVAVLGAAAWWINASAYVLTVPCAAWGTAALPMLARANRFRGDRMFNQIVILLISAAIGAAVGRLISDTLYYEDLWRVFGTLVCMVPPAFAALLQTLTLLRRLHQPPSPQQMYPPVDEHDASVMVATVESVEEHEGQRRLVCRMPLPDGRTQAVIAPVGDRVPEPGAHVAVLVTQLVEQADGAWWAQARVL